MHIGAITIHDAEQMRAIAQESSGFVWITIGDKSDGNFDGRVSFFITGVSGALNKAERIAAAFNAIMAEDVVKGEPAPTPLAAE